jgi:hypothetical protein
MVSFWIRKLVCQANAPEVYDDGIVGDVFGRSLPDGGLRVGFVLLLPEVEQSAKLNDFRCEGSGETQFEHWGSPSGGQWCL